MPATSPPSGSPPPELSSAAPPPGTRLRPHFSECFACGADQAAGLHLAAVVGEGASVVATFTVTRSHQGAPGLAHGGLLATAVDEAMGFLLSLIGEPAVTAHLEVDYVLPVPVGDVVTLTAHGLARAGRKIWADVTGVLPDGRTALTGSALFVTVGIEHFTSAAPAEAFHSSILSRYNP